MLAVAGLTRLVGARPGESALAGVRHIERELEILSRYRFDEHGRRIAYLGDSTVYSPVPRNSLPHLLEAALRGRFRDRMPVEVRSLAYPALGIISQYLIADRIVEAEPDLILWQTSFTHFSDMWRLYDLRSAFAGWVDLERLPELVGMPIESGGLTVDRLLLYQGMVAMRGVGAWSALRGEQSRVQKLRGHLERWVSRHTGVRSEELFRRAGMRELRKRNEHTRDGRRRFTAKIELSRQGDALTGLDPDDLVLQMLSRTLDLFRRSGIPVIVYLSPMNIENLAAVGLSNEEEMARSVGLVREVVESNGARFLDLHALFPDAYFRDAQGHLVHDAGIDANVELIRRLAGPVIAELKRSGRR